MLKCLLIGLKDSALPAGSNLRKKYGDAIESILNLILGCRTLIDSSKKYLFDLVCFNSTQLLTVKQILIQSQPYRNFIFNQLVKPEIQQNKLQFLNSINETSEQLVKKNAFHLFHFMKLLKN